MYNRLNNITYGEIASKGKNKVLRFYSKDEKKIVIDSRLIPAQRKETVLHELAHAIARGNQKRFKSDVQAFDKAFTEHKKSNPTAVEKSFSRNTSPCAQNAKTEALAEAFSDVPGNGKNATHESISIMKNWKNKR